MSIGQSLEVMSSWLVDMGTGTLLRRFFVVGVIGLLAFVFVPSRSDQARSELVLSIVSMLGPMVVVAMLVVLLACLWGRD